jgi:Amt family ammonium transporter
LLNGFFASKTITALDGSTSIPGGWIDGNWKQLYIQFGYVCATCIYSFAVTANIANGLNRIPGLGLRATEEAEKLGMDEAEVCLHVINVVFFYERCTTTDWGICR